MDLVLITGRTCVATRPTDPFTISEIHNPMHDVPELHKNRRSPDFEAVHFLKGRWGSQLSSAQPCQHLHVVVLAVWGDIVEAVTTSDPASVLHLFAMLSSSIQLGRRKMFKEFH